MISVVVADDHPLVRNGVRAVLEVEDDIVVVAEAEDGRAAAELAARHDADVVLMDVEMPGCGGLEGLDLVAGLSPRTAVVMLTLYDLEEYVEAALRGGAAGFVLKTGAPQELVSAVRTASRGGLTFSRAVTERMVEAYLERPTDAAPRLQELTEALSERELEVWTALSDGLSNAEISARLHLSEATVKTYVTRLFTKLQVRDRVQAVVLAFQSGLVGGEPSSEG